MKQQISGEAMGPLQTVKGSPPGGMISRPSRRRAAALRESEASFRAIFDHAGLGIVLVETEQWRIAESNPAFSALSGYTAAELRNRSLLELFPEADRAFQEDLFRKRLAGESGDGQLEQKYVHRSGRIIWANVACSMIPRPDGSPRFLLIMINDITARKKTEEAASQALALAEESRARAERLACTDCLTGLLNQRALMSRLNAELNRARREHLPLSIILIDLDYFKQINDTYGHLAGDLALKTFAACLAANCRPDDFVGRYGGEEFIVCLPETAATEAVGVAERLRSAMSGLAITLPDAALPIEVTASFGVATLRAGSGITLERLFHRADQAMYQAKRAGRNRVQVYSGPEPFPLAETSPPGPRRKGNAP
ncbi:PAS domain S-box-containing protein/diguanylate cyclase (GGDEF)-like protein [Hydrogenispora ethanolica]|uniref:PAS domain S-box-containing protein/diguanylate cyclase (GGDEF)-like protein n=1 Tax=Hydrogenispora ethanolica TaxID=1082276 RepID=A0A4R1RGW4_HYDET|nr:diguanylate cyclase [Hydrogenispora ethanolica]TCL65273.1 PAS domain S-box-containing protein/diguanylate cyclase (GGDEF)-like protein [Hydrogenispora ethanolica]